jgi:hypothetical protein
MVRDRLAGDAPQGDQPAPDADALIAPPAEETPPLADPAIAEVAPAEAKADKYPQSRVDEQTGIVWIWLHHPKTRGEFECTVEAYEQEEGWKEKGWEPGRLPDAVASTPAAGGVA